MTGMSQMINDYSSYFNLRDYKSQSEESKAAGAELVVRFKKDVFLWIYRIAGSLSAGWEPAGALRRV